MLFLYDRDISNISTHNLFAKIRYVCLKQITNFHKSAIPNFNILAVPLISEIEMKPSQVYESLMPHSSLALISTLAFPVF